MFFSDVSVFLFFVNSLVFFFLFFLFFLFFFVLFLFYFIYNEYPLDVAWTKRYPMEIHDSTHGTVEQ